MAYQALGEHPRRRERSRLSLTAEEYLNAGREAMLHKPLRVSHDLTATYLLVCDFLGMLLERKWGLEGWENRTPGAGAREIESVATELRCDETAVRARLSLPYSSNG